jgi:hypothetical protein
MYVGGEFWTVLDSSALWACVSDRRLHACSGLGAQPLAASGPCIHQHDVRHQPDQQWTVCTKPDLERPGLRGQVEQRPQAAGPEELGARLQVPLMQVFKGNCLWVCKDRQVGM